MPNIVVDQAKLVLNTFAATFQNNLVAKDLVTWRQFNGEMNDRNSLTVVEQVGPRYNVTETINGVADLTSGVQDTVFGSEQFTIDRTFGSSMGWGDFQKIRDLGDARESEALKAASQQLAEKIDSYIIRETMLASNNWTGTPGNTVSTFNDVASGYTRLKDEGVETGDFRAVMSYYDKQALGDWVVNNNDSALSDANGIYRSGFSGTVADVPTMFTQALPTLTSGSRPATGVLINGAAQNKNYKEVSISTAPGRYLTQTISVDGLTGTQTIRKGETFTIDGVFAYDNRSQVSQARLQQFTVVEDATAVAGAIAALRIFPALVVPGTGTGADIGVNTAHATVTAAPADNAAITFNTAANSAHRLRAILSKDAITVNTVDLIMPATGKAMRKALTQIPLSIRMWQDSTFATGEHRVRFDVALRANVHDRRRIVRINGA